MAGKPNAHAFDGQTLIMHRSFRNDVGDLWLNQVGLDLRRVSNVVEFDNMVAVTRAAERDGGIALVPAIVCQPWFERGALVHIEGFDLTGTRRITSWPGAAISTVRKSARWSRGRSNNSRFRRNGGQRRVTKGHSSIDETSFVALQHQT